MWGFGLEKPVLFIHAVVESRRWDDTAVWEDEPTTFGRDDIARDAIRHRSLGWVALRGPAARRGLRRGFPGMREAKRERRGSSNRTKKRMVFFFFSPLFVQLDSRLRASLFLSAVVFVVDEESRGWGRRARRETR